MTHAEIIQSIDAIDAISKESELAVMEAMISDVEKYVVMMENYNGDVEQFESIFQEGDILKRVKKEGKKDSNKFVTVLMFIPRLIRALADIINSNHLIPCFHTCLIRFWITAQPVFQVFF